MSVTGDLLGTALSGLTAYQRALAVTGHNTTNVNTPGYTRQSIQMSTRPASFSGAGFIGNGVNVDTVARSYGQFVTAQLRNATISNGQYDAYYGFAKQMDNIVADTQTGLSPALQDFFNATSAVANDPSSTAARQVMLAQAKALANRFHSISSRLDTLETNANEKIRSAITDINSLAQTVAQLNQQVFELQGSAGGQSPNDLLDQRDEALRKLAEHIAISVSTKSDGTVDVFAGTGQSLVLGNTSAKLSALSNEYDPQSLDIGFSFNSGSVVNVTQSMSGGSLGGTLQFRDGLLHDARNQLGRVAVGLSNVFNAQQHLGIDQQNTLGGDFFTNLGTQQAQLSRNNNAATDFVFTGTLTNAAALQATDYRINYNAGIYSITRLSDNTVLASSAVPVFNLTATDGFTVSAVGTTISNGDSFVLSMTKGVAGSFGVAATQTTQIAAAAPLRTRATPTNAGAGAISQGDVSNASNLPLAAPITLTFNPNALGAGVPGFIVTGGPGGTLAYNPATEYAGKSFSFPTYGGFSFSISGVPATGDTFTISNNSNGIGDNRNALALAGLQTKATLVNGATGPTTSIFGAYAQLVSDIGSGTRQAEIDSQAQTTLLTQAQEAWSNQSGVNLDEEAANIVRFQQVYQASAQLVTSSSEMFNALLSAIRG